MIENIEGNKENIHLCKTCARGRQCSYAQMINEDITHFLGMIARANSDRALRLHIGVEVTKCKKFSTILTIERSK